MKRTSLFLSAAIASLVLTVSAGAGPFRDAEAQVAGAYADYRVALMKTNQNDKPGSETALRDFRAKWTALASAWRAAPPPQYADDTDLAKTLDDVAKAAGAADASLQAGAIARSHEELEAIRDQLAALRARNGVTGFSDRMNAYHAHMEHVVGGGYDSFSPAGLLALREDAAVLAYLANEIASAPWRGDHTAFDEQARAIVASVAALRQALASGDGEAVKKARSQIKPAYARMFGRFG